MKIVKCLLYICLCFVGISCNDTPEPTIAPGSGQEPSDGTANVSVFFNTTYQTIESFSASDCWLPNYIGTYWDENEKEGIAKLLFSQNIKDGQPEGIGLSGWRFNLGGGTAQQGAASDIEDPSRRAESFMNPTDGSLDWTKQSGQQYFLQKAKSYGCEQFVMFSNTPPVYMTRNGKGYSAMGAYSNLKEDSYDDFAEYITTVIDYFKTNKGIDIAYISPVNEPQYNWDGPGQEGSGWQNSEIKKLAVEIDKSIEEKGLNTKILLSEAAAWNYLYETDGDNNRKNVIYNLFDQSSSSYVGNLKHVAPIIAGHSYWTDGTWSKLVDTRTIVASKASVAGLKVYQTEWSMLGDGYSANEFVGFDNATYMDIALYMSKVIHCDLVYGNVASWSFWTSVDLERWNHKNRFLLIKATPEGGVYGDVKQSGTHESTKTLWVLGNYSLFIRPDYKRIGFEMKNSSKDLFGSAYISQDSKRLVCVYTNLSKQQYDAKVDLDNAAVKSIKRYTTSQTQDLVEGSIMDVNSSILISPKSIVTVVYELR
ncbi:beta-glycosidase [Dysgonomonas sp. Marseille-P4677]|uniref:glycoside hydrolase n=1 Tax=Dysgonomonas sp. Marseille-P4677 TaxID=2364790 RepID=UPI001912589B|nr:glycoside hydrolase [Dysgonomonas sp. Marseille-P4677]MBK5719345.1 beta-glycosidase [Dysgonomonas sp. Marseille-P4677]